MARSAESARKHYHTYFDAILRESEKLLKELTAAQLSATRRGDADEAAAIAARIQFVSEGWLRDEAEVEVDVLGRAVTKRWRDAPAKLLLAADDRVECRINGGIVASTAAATDVQSVVVGITSGDIIACKVWNGGGDAGMCLHLQTERGTDVLTTSDEWRTYRPADPQRWWNLDDAGDMGKATLMTADFIASVFRTHTGSPAAPIWGDPAEATIYVFAVVP